MAAALAGRYERTAEIRSHRGARKVTDDFPLRATAQTTHFEIHNIDFKTAVPPVTLKVLLQSTLCKKRQKCPRYKRQRACCKRDSAKRNIESMDFAGNMLRRQPDIKSLSEQSLPLEIESLSSA